MEMANVSGEKFSHGDEIKRISLRSSLGVPVGMRREQFTLCNSQRPCKDGVFLKCSPQMP